MARRRKTTGLPTPPERRAPSDPRLVAAEWIDPDDNNPNRREAKRVTGLRRRDVLAELHARDPELITRSMFEAGQRYRSEVEIAAGRSRISSAYHSDGGSYTSALEPSERMLAASKSVREAAVALDGSEDSPHGLRAALDAVVAGSWTLKEYAHHERVNAHVAKGFLIAALRRLDAHYSGDDSREWQ